jgi:uncharacterized secreted repeat protein (TIGR03808 family)
LRRFDHPDADRSDGRGAIDRRSLVGVTIAALLAPALGPFPRPAHAETGPAEMRGSLDATQEGLVPGGDSDQSAALVRALAKAEVSGQPLFLPPGRYAIAEVELPRHAHISGVPGQTRLIYRGGSFMMRARGAALLRLDGITVDGAGLPLDKAAGRGLLVVDTADNVVLDDCEFVASEAAAAILRTCSGRIADCRISDAGTVGIRLVESRGMLLRGNSVTACGDTGILVEREEAGSDDTIVQGNRVTAIRSDSGGTGQYGNGINIARANGVIVAGNRIDGCAFSAIRCFSSDNVQVAGNVMTDSGEMALYVEFAFEGAVVADNLIDGAASGISFANFMEHGGRLGVCSGNVVRRITGGRRLGAGIGAEADVAITGNVVEDAVWGLQLGWGPYLRDLTVTGNVIRRSRIGIGVSVVEGAGAAVIANNVISGAAHGAILGMRWEEPVTTDLADSGAQAWSHLTIAGNRAD